MSRHQRITHGALHPILLLSVFWIIFQTAAFKCVHGDDQMVGGDFTERKAKWFSVDLTKKKPTNCSKGR